MTDFISLQELTSYFIMSIGAVIGSFAISVFMNNNYKISMYNGIFGGLSWFVYLCIEKRAGIFASVFAGSFLVALCAQIWSRRLKCPVTLFLIPALTPLVPGKPLYRFVHAFISGHSSEAGNFAANAFLMAWAIALGIILVEAFYAMIKGVNIKLLKRDIH